jgi:BON domain-containing protein
MNEPLFGSASPGWPATPYPPTSWLQASGPLANRLLASPTSGLPGTPGFMSGTTTGQPVSLHPAGAFVPSGVMPIGATVPGLAGSEIAVGVTTPALLATVAVRRGQPLGPTNDLEIEDFIYDALELLPGSNDVDVRCEGGRVTFTGQVHYRRLKRDVGEIAWSIPAVNDVQNNVTIAARRRSRTPGRESEPAATAARKSA